jgi:hypothetical protein
MSSVKDVRPAHVWAAANIDDLDKACLSLQQQAGITDGGVAGLVLGHLKDRWHRISAAEREGWLLLWMQHERLYEDSRRPA